MPNHAYILAMLHYSTIANPPRGGSRPGSGTTFHLLKGTHSITTTRMAYEVYLGPKSVSCHEKAPHQH